MTPKPLLLLDLHYTFAIDEPWHRGTRLSTRIPREQYRPWIINLARDYEATVLLTTARPERYAEITLDHISEACSGWQPHGAYFRQIDGEPHVGKEDNLRRIIADHGEPGTHWIGFESNSKTRAMYRRYGIYSLPVHRLEVPLASWPVNPETSDADPFTLP
ncbi:phosphatase [Gordonia phage Evaa]|nr:phosphatase [Gordonia phage Evaa]